MKNPFNFFNFFFWRFADNFKFWLTILINHVLIQHKNKRILKKGELLKKMPKIEKSTTKKKIKKNFQKKMKKMKKLISKFVWKVQKKNSLKIVAFFDEFFKKTLEFFKYFAMPLLPQKFHIKKRAKRAFFMVFKN